MNEEKIDEMRRLIIAGLPARESRFIGELFPGEPPVTTPENIQWCVSPTGTITITHPDRRPMEVVDGRLRYIGFTEAAGPTGEEKP